MNKQTKKNLFNVAIAGAVVASSVVALAPVNAQAATNFKDLQADHMHYDDIKTLVERGILTGYPDGTFKADQSLTRAEAAIIIARILGLDTENVTDPGFKDVPKSKFYYGAVAALAEKKIILGYGDGTYGDSKTLTRGEMAIILQRAFDLGGTTELPFTDVKGTFFEPYVGTLYANEVTKGISATKFGVNDPVTRGQISAFVVRAEASNTVTTVNATEVATTLVNALVDTLKPTLTDIGELTIGTPTVKNADVVIKSGTPIVLNFDDSKADVLFAELLSGIDTTKIKDEVKNKVAPIILELPAETVGHIDSIYIGDQKINTENISAENYIDQLTNGLTKDTLNSVLTSLIDLDIESATSLTVAQYFESEKAANQTSIIVTFDDNTSLEYAITIQK